MNFAILTSEAIQKKKLQSFSATISPQFAEKTLLLFYVLSEFRPVKKKDDTSKITLFIVKRMEWQQINRIKWNLIQTNGLKIFWRFSLWCKCFFVWLKRKVGGTWFFVILVIRKTIGNKTIDSGISEAERYVWEKQRDLEETREEQRKLEAIKKEEEQRWGNPEERRKTKLE